MPEPGTYDPIFGVYSPYPGEGYASAAPPQTPSVVINQNFAPEAAHPVLRDYTTTPLPQPGQQPDQTQQQPEGRQNGTQAGTTNAAGVYDQPLFLIAMKDHTIYPALAYWVDVDKGVLNYITVQGTPNQVSLSLVDRDLSKRLNDERGMTFRLPLAK